MSEKNRHDIVTKRVLSEKKYAVGLLRNTLPKEITDRLDFERLQIEKGSFVDPKDRERFTDMLFSIPLKKQGELGIFCLVEHKSQPDRHIHRQLLSYLAGIYQSKKQVSVVLPLVLYHGRKKWSLVSSFSVLLSIPEELKVVLQKYIPDFTYELLDLSSEKTELARFPAALRAFLKNLKDIWYLSDKAILRELFRDFFKPLGEEDRILLDILFSYIIQSVEVPEVEILFDFADKHISKEAGRQFMTIAEKLEKKGIEKGIEQGIEKGIKEVTLNLLEKDIALDIISETTGLSLEEIRSLRDES